MNTTSFNELLTLRVIIIWRRRIILYIIKFKFTKKISTKYVLEN